MRKTALPISFDRVCRPSAIVRVVPLYQMCGRVAYLHVAFSCLIANILWILKGFFCMNPVSVPPPLSSHSVCYFSLLSPQSLLSFSLSPCPLSLLYHCSSPPPIPPPESPPSVSPGSDGVIFVWVAVTVPDWQCDPADIQELGEGTGDTVRAEWTVDRWRQWPRGSQRLP